jgi:hypothetical protein
MSSRKNYLHICMAAFLYVFSDVVQDCSNHQMFCHSRGIHKNEASLRYVHGDAHAEQIATRVRICSEYGLDCGAKNFVPE